MPGLVFPRLDEEFHFHLFEFPGAENKVSRRNFVAEAFSDLSNTKRRLHPRGGHHIIEVHKNSLRRFGAQIMHASFVIDWTQVRFEQPTKRLRVGKFSFIPTVRAGNIGKTVLGGSTLFLFVLFEQVIATVALVAPQALHEWVAKDFHVTGGFPHSLGQNHG